MAYVILYAFASIVATIVQCTPIKRIWDHSVPGTCINLTAFWYANASANIIGDFLILALPMPVIRSLQLPRRQRLGLVMVFALGGLWVMLAISRLIVLIFVQCLYHIDLADDHPRAWIQSQRSDIRHPQLDHLDHHRGQHCNHMCLSTHAQESFGRAFPSTLSPWLCSGIFQWFEP